MKTIYIILLLVIVSVQSCDWELEKVEPNSVTVDVYYQSADDLIKSVNSVYAVLQGHTMMAREWFFIHNMRGDDVASGGGQLEAHRARMLNGVHNPDDYIVDAIWSACYGLIHRANVVITKAPDVSMDDEDLRSRLVGEAKFLRAWAYFELVSQYGGVPLYSEYVTDFVQSEPRATEDAVYNLIITDLNDAIGSLPSEYEATNLGRATEGAAMALLSRVYMYRGNYTDAKRQLQAIIDLDIYELTNNYSDNFLEETEYNSESVFEVGFMDQGPATGWGQLMGDAIGKETTLRGQEVKAISWRNLIPSDGLIAEFEHTSYGDAKNDPRFTYNFYLTGDIFNNGTDTLKDEDVRGELSDLRGVDAFVSWRKHSLMYKMNRGYYPSGLNERVIRYAEVLLMMAECQNETDESEANVLASLNQLRDRADVAMPNYPTANYPTSTKEERFRAIMHEKRVELANECIRDRDLARWYKNGKINLAELQSYIPYFTPNMHELQPIPQSEIDRNPEVNQEDQNPGY